MQAEERKDLETNSLAQSLSSLKGKLDARTWYYLIGTVLLVIAGWLLFRYFNKQSGQNMDARFLSLEMATSSEKLKTIMEEQRGTMYGSIAKLHLARRALTVDGLEKIGTDKIEDRNKAAASLEEARVYFGDLTKEFKANEDAALLQEAWVGLARAEEALVGLPTADGSSDSRGNIEKAIEAYNKAGAILPDLELSKKYVARGKLLSDDKAKFIATQKIFYSLPTPPVTKKEEPKKEEPKKEEPKKEEPKKPEVKTLEPAPKTVTPEPKATEPKAK